MVFANRQREAPPGADRAERRLFETRIECAVESGELAEYPRVDPNLLTDEEQEIELQYRDTHIYAIGHGAAANWSLEPDRPPRIWSESMPAVDVPVVTTEVDGLDDEVLVLHDIAEAPFDDDHRADWTPSWTAMTTGLAGSERRRSRFAAGEKAAVRICAQMDAASENGCGRA